ncbi:MAG: NUDIX domain-containing protein [Rhizomicrobium sp.]
MADDLTERVRIRDEHMLFHKRCKLSEYDIDYRRNDGTWQRQNREIFDRKHAAAVLPIDPKRGTVILVSQFRLPAFLTDHKKPLVEVIAGSLDNDAPDVCARREAMEEAGVEVHDLKQVFHCFMSPGAVTERMYLFVATYNGRAAKGGGLQDEGEDIEVLEMPLSEAMAMTRNGEIVDIKTIALLQWVQLNTK